MVSREKGQVKEADKNKMRLEMEVFGALESTIKNLHLLDEG